MLIGVLYFRATSLGPRSVLTSVIGHPGHPPLLAKLELGSPKRIGRRGVGAGRSRLNDDASRARM